MTSAHVLCNQEKTTFLVLYADCDNYSMQPYIRYGYIIQMLERFII